jgi:proteic killer suppression protein
LIRSFGDKRTRRVWEGIASRKLPDEIQNAARRKLRMLNNAQDIHDLKIPPANRLEKLSGDRKGYYSIRINQQWRIVFKWESGDAHEVRISDYH